MLRLRLRTETTERGSKRFIRSIPLSALFRFNLGLRVPRYHVARHAALRDAKELHQLRFDPAVNFNLLLAKVGFKAVGVLMPVSPVIADTT